MKFGMKKKINPMRSVGIVAGFILGLFVLSRVINILGGIVNYSNSSDMFYQVYQFLGLGTGGAGLITVGMIIAALWVVFDGIVDVKM